MRLLFICGLFWISICGLQAQDAHFSQMYASPMHLNPAFVGSSPEGKFSFSYRAQWAKLPGEFATYQASYEYSTPKKPTNVGVMVLMDKVGAVGATSTQVQGFYAHNIKLTKQVGLRAGVQASYSNRSLDYFKLTFGDQLDELGYTGSPTAEQGLPNLNVSYWDAGAGLVLYAEDFWIGISAYHLNEPRYNWGSSIEFVPRRYAVQAGFKIAKPKAGKDKNDNAWTLIPALHYSQQGSFRQLDAGINYHINSLLLGVWYRGLPVAKTHYAALVSMAGFQYKQFAFMYSYDLGLSQFALATGGAHEFSLGIKLGTYESKRKLRRKSNELIFPQFMF